MTAKDVRRGLAVALAGYAGVRAFAWRRNRRRPAEVRELHQVDLPPNADGAGVVLAVNPNAGSADGALAAELRERLPAAEVIELEDPAELGDVLEKAASTEGTVAIGAAGGDGTANFAAGIAAAHGLPLLVIPGGTLNHLARDLGLDTVADATEAIRAGTALQVDLPRIDGEPFLNTASFGSYAELVDLREDLEDRIGKWPALLVAATRVLRQGAPIRVEVDGDELRLWMIFIGNCRYRPDGFAPSRRPRLDDGQLDVRWIDAGHPYSRIRLVLGLVTGRLGRSPVYRQWVTTSLRVRSLDGPLRLARDGETFDGGEEIEVAKVGERIVLYGASRGSA